MATNYRDYNAEEKAACLAIVEACGGNVAKAARQTGVPERTLRYWHREGIGISPDTAKLAEVKTRDLAQLFEDHARDAMMLAVNRLDDPETTYADTIRGAAIAVDKMRLLREQATTITQEAPATIEDKQTRLRELASKHGLKLVVNE